MRTRATIFTLSIAILVATGAVAQAQQSARIPRIGVLTSSRCPGAESPFLVGLQERGYAVGRTLSIECRAAEGEYDRLPSLAAELVSLKVDVIFAPTHPDALAAKSATGSIPIVFIATGEPIRTGLVASLARPGGNLTGLHYYATELGGKRLELLKESLAGVTRVGVLAHPVTESLTLPDVLAAARILGIRLHLIEVKAPGEIEAAFAAMVAERDGALLVLPDVMLSLQARRITELAAKHHLPAVYPFHFFVQVGGLMAYGADVAELARRAAFYVDKILKGAKPADLPVEQPTKFELVINLKTAKALGLTIPPSLLLRADQIIQ